MLRVVVNTQVVRGTVAGCCRVHDVRAVLGRAVGCAIGASATGEIVRGVRFDVGCRLCRSPLATIAILMASGREC